MTCKNSLLHQNINISINFNNNNNNNKIIKLNNDYFKFGLEKKLVKIMKKEKTNKNIQLITKLLLYLFINDLE